MWRAKKKKKKKGKKFTTGKGRAAIDRRVMG
jgi:hypothetical protein